MPYHPEKYCSCTKYSKKDDEDTSKIRPYAQNGKDSHNKCPSRPHKNDERDKRRYGTNEKDRVSDDADGKYNRDGRHKVCVKPDPDDRRDRQHGGDTEYHRFHKKPKKSYQDDYEEDHVYDSGGKKKKPQKSNKSKNQDEEDTHGQKNRHPEVPQRDDRKYLEGSYVIVCGKNKKYSKHNSYADVKKYATYRKHANNDDYGSDESDGKGRNDKNDFNMNDKYNNNKYDNYKKRINDSCCSITKHDDDDDDDNIADQYGNNRPNRYGGRTADKHDIYRRGDITDKYNNNNKYDNHGKGINNSCCGITNNDDVNAERHRESECEKQDRYANKYESYKSDKNKYETDTQRNKTRYDRDDWDEYDANQRYQRNQDGNEQMNDTSGNRRHRHQNENKRDGQESNDSIDNNQDRMIKGNSKDNYRRQTYNYPDNREMEDNNYVSYQDSILGEFKLKNNKCYYRQLRKKIDNERMNDTDKDKQLDKCMICIKFGKLKLPRKRNKE